MRFRRDGRHFATAIKVWFCSLKKGSQIALSVGLVHLGAILWMSMDHWLSDHPKPHHPIVVRTVRPQMAPIHVASAPTPHSTNLSQNNVRRDQAACTIAVQNSYQCLHRRKHFIDEHPIDLSPLPHRPAPIISSTAGSGIRARKNHSLRPRYTFLCPDSRHQK